MDAHELIKICKRDNYWWHDAEEHPDEVPRHVFHLLNNTQININKKDNISFIKLDVENHELEALHGMNKILKKNSPIICFEQHADHFDNYDEELSSTVIIFLKDNEYLFFYELLSSRDWKFFNNYHPLVEKIIKLFEVLLIGTPKITNKINRINKFSKKKYLAIISSKKKL